MTKKNKKLSCFLLAFVMLFTMALANIEASAAASGFYVSGTTLYDANGNPFVMRGVNIAHAWYPSYTETSIKAAASLGCNTVRIVLSDGGQYSKTSYSEVSNIIDWCKKYKVVCVLEVHDATGSDSTSDLDRAVNYWKELKDLLNANRKYVIVNIANEWYGTWDGSGWANGYKSAIKSLRSAGIKNTLIVDCAGWGQYPASIFNYGKDVFNADSEGNTIFSIHMYEYAGGNASTVKSNIDNALKIGVPVIIGEFGCYHTNGDVDEYTIMSYCKSKNVGYLGWSWKGNGSSWSYLDLANNWDGSSLTSWGNTLFNSSDGIKNTSTVCSVYSGSSGGGGSGLDGVYYIKNVNSGMYLDVYYGLPDNGTNIRQHSYNGSNAQKFKLVSDGNGYYTILTGASGYNSAVDVEGKKSADGTNILQWESNGGDNQKFQIVKVGNAYAIKTKISNCNSVIEVYQQSKENCANVVQWSYNGGSNQLWYLEPAN